MARSRKPHDLNKPKNPAKVEAGRKGGKAKAANQSSDSPDGNLLADIPGPSQQTSIPKPNFEIGTKLAKEPASIVSSYGLTTSTSTLPVTIKSSDGKTWTIRQQIGTQQASISFWDMLASKIKEIKQDHGYHLFGAQVDDLNRDFHLELAAHLFPQLINRSGQLRYSKANPSELIVAKKDYQTYLRRIRNNTDQLLMSHRADTAAQQNPLTSNNFTQRLLTIAPRSQPTIPEHQHIAQIEGHETNLTHIAELLRQGLVATGVLSSNYADEARKLHITLEATCAYLIQLLGHGDSNVTGEVKAEGDSNDGAIMPSSEASTGAGFEAEQVNLNQFTAINSSNQPGKTATPAAKLPDFMIVDVLEGHTCRCNQRYPQLEENMVGRVTAQLLANKRAELTDSVRKDLVAKVRAENLPKAREGAYQQVLEETRAVRWQEERTVIRKGVEEELLPLLRRELMLENQENLRASIREELVPTLRKELREEIEQEIRDENKRKLRELGIL